MTCTVVHTYPNTLSNDRAHDVHILCENVFFIQKFITTKIVCEGECARAMSVHNIFFICYIESFEQLHLQISLNKIACI